MQYFLKRNKIISRKSEINSSTKNEEISYAQTFVDANKTELQTEEKMSNNFYENNLQNLEIDGDDLWSDSLLPIDADNLISF